MLRYLIPVLCLLLTGCYPYNGNYYGNPYPFYNYPPPLQPYYIHARPLYPVNYVPAQGHPPGRGHYNGRERH